MNVQVDQTSFPDIGSNEFGSNLDSGKQQGQIASGSGAETHLVVQDMS